MASPGGGQRWSFRKGCDFVRGTVFIYVGTRDERLWPTVTESFGAQVTEDRRRLVCYVMEPLAHKTLENLQQKGQAAAVISQGIAPYESYPFKGAYIEHRSSEAHEYAVQEVWFDKLCSSMEAFMPRQVDIARTKMRRRPTVAITLRVREVYDQTPGPGAGRLVDVVR